MIRRIDLGNEGHEFIRSQLNDGDYLALAVLNLPLRDGETYTFLPETIDPAHLSLVHGGLGKFEFDEDHRGPVIDLCQEFLSASSTHLAIFELHAIEKGPAPAWVLGTRHLTLASSRHRIYQAPNWKEPVSAVSVYGFVDGANATPAEVRDSIGGARPYPRIGVLTSLALHRRLSPGQEIDRDLLEELAERTRHIIVGAYDEEGFAVWSKRN